MTLCPQVRRFGPALVAALLLHGAALAFLMFGLRSHERVTPPPVREVVVQLVAQPQVTPPAPPPLAPKPRPLPLPVVKPLPPPREAPVLTSAVPVAPAVGRASARQEELDVASVGLKADPPPPLPVSAPRFDAAYLDNPKPEYPLMARRNGDEGKVVLRVQVTAEGRAAEVQLHSSSGSSALDKAARAAVHNWRFVPARQGSQAVAAWVLVPVVFKLQD